MAENVAYLKEMLEVPFEGGHSQDVCGQDDNFYAFGLWTDFCGLSDEEMRKAAIANAAGSSDCCGGGGGGDTGSTRTENKVVITLDLVDGKYVVNATAQKPVDIDITIEVPYIVDGGEYSGTLNIYNGSKTGSFTIGETTTRPEIGTMTYEESGQSDKYDYVYDDETDAPSGKNVLLYGPVKYLDMENQGVGALTGDVLSSLQRIDITTDFKEFSAKKDAEYVEEYTENNPDKEELELEHTYDFVFLLDETIASNEVDILDISGPRENPVSLGNSIGSVERDGITFNVYRLTNLDGWGVIIGPGEDPEGSGYEWKYKVKKD